MRCWHACSRSLPATGSRGTSARSSRRRRRIANHIAELRSALAQPRLRDVDTMLVSFALAKELEDVGEFAQSFDTLLQANRIKRRTLTYDVMNDVRAMQNVMKHYSAEAMQALSGGDETPGPIFIVGMPRTGNDARRADPRQPLRGRIRGRGGGLSGWKWRRRRARRTRVWD